MLEPKIYTTKFIAGNYKYPVTITYDKKRMFVDFSYNEQLKNEIKSMAGAKWHGFDTPPRKIWSIANSARNWFNIYYLEGKNPYERYDRPLIKYTPTRKLYSQQIEMVEHILTRCECVIAGEMGTGKTLAAIEVMEKENHLEWWYVAPKSALRAVKLMFEFWVAKVYPRFLTYEELTKVMKNWKDGTKAPQGLFLDESSKLKTPTTQRTQAAMALAEGMRQDHVIRYIICMTGSPAPKAPTDWWSQCEIACPGYIKEGHINKFRDRLAIVKPMNNALDGTSFNTVVTWKDSNDKCSECGLLKDDPMHVMGDHMFTPCSNEIEKLHKRLRGLVYVKFKKDCLDLPEKRYEEVTLTPTREIERIAGLIKKTSPRAIQALILLRELSDGFQYTEIKTGKTEICPTCKGTGKIITPIVTLEEAYTLDEVNEERLEVLCEHCFGEGKLDCTRRETKEIPTPKEDTLIEDLENHEDVGRLVVYAGFTGSIDRCVKIILKQGWSVIRVDGRGWNYTDKEGKVLSNDALKDFQYGDAENKICFVGHPGSAGMGLTLTRSPTIVYWSNDFNAESRIQSEDRIHRIGMDVNRGATIRDYIHLPIDKIILENLKMKRSLQNLTLGELG